MALRLCLTLGLHHNLPEGYPVSAVERENRIRVWWSVYITDRITSSKLGHPVTVRDSDIDVDLPSMDGLTPTEREEFSDPSHLVAHVKLARITGDIIGDIYGRSGQAKAFVQSVQKILRSLRSWAETLPESVQISPGKPQKYAARNVASLHLCFNQVSLFKCAVSFIALSLQNWAMLVRNSNNTPNIISCFQISFPTTRSAGRLIDDNGSCRRLYPCSTQFKQSFDAAVDRWWHGDLWLLRLTLLIFVYYHSHDVQYSWHNQQRRRP